MNDQNETAQLRFLEETATRLRQNGFTVEPIEDHHLPVCWEKGRLCRISGKGSVLYRQECVDVPGAQDALQTVIDTAKMLRNTWRFWKPRRGSKPAVSSATTVFSLTSVTRCWRATPPSEASSL